MVLGNHKNVGMFRNLILNHESEARREEAGLVRQGRLGKRVSSFLMLRAWVFKS